MTLLASWGIVADVDIESENMRRLGEARFILGQCMCACVLRGMVYFGSVYVTVTQYVQWGRGEGGVGEVSEGCTVLPQPFSRTS